MLRIEYLSLGKTYFSIFKFSFLQVDKEKYKCEICGVLFSMTESFLYHMRVVHEINVSQSSSNACKDEPKDSHQVSLVPSTTQCLTLTDSNNSLEIDYTSSLVSSNTSSESLTSNNKQRSESETRTDNQEVRAFDDVRLDNIQEKSNSNTYALGKCQTTEIDLFPQYLRARHGEEISSKAEVHTHTVEDDGYTTGQSSTTMSVTRFNHDTASDYNTENHSSRHAENNTLPGKEKDISLQNKDQDVRKQCNICKMKFKTIFGLFRHNRTVHGTKQYKCLHCSFTTAQEHSLKRHQIRHQCHDKEKPNANESVTKRVSKDTNWKFQTAGDDLFTRQLRSRHGKKVAYRAQGNTSSDEEDGNTTDHNDSTTSDPSFSYDSSTDFDKENHSSGDDNDKGGAVSRKKNDTGLQKKDPVVSIQCNLCQVNFKRKSSLYHHGRTVHGSEIYKCSNCGYTARRENTLRCHQKKHHQNDKESNHETESVTEHLRMYINSDNESVEKQKPSRESGFYKCSFCPFITDCEDDIEQHMNDLPIDTSMTELLTPCQQRWLNQIKRTVTSLYKCNICSFQTVQKRTFNRHKQTAHVKKRTFSCESCSMAFTNIRHLWYHCKVVHGPKIYKCHHCDYTTNRKYNLDKHQKRFNCFVQPKPMDNLEESQGAPIIKHNKKVFDCNHCEYRTDQRELMKQHQKRFHGHLSPNKRDNLDNTKTDRNQSSVGQDKSLEHLDWLQNSRRASHHVKAVAANRISKNGFNSAVIATHVNKNITNNKTKNRKIKKARCETSGAKKKGKSNPLHCKLCRLTFKATNALKRHKISIHGPKSLNCDHCGYKTNRKDLFDKHGIRFNCSYNGNGQNSVEKSDKDVHAKENSHEIMPHVETTTPIDYTRITRSRSRIDSGADNKMEKDKSKVNSSPAKMKKKSHLLQCKSCNISFNKKINFIRHQKLIHEPKRFNCQHCGFKGNRKDTFDKHYNRFNCPKQSQGVLHSDRLPGAVQGKEINRAEIPYDLAVETAATVGITASVDDSDNIDTSNVNTGVYSDTSIHAIGQKTTTAQEVAATNPFQCKICKRTLKDRNCLKGHERKVHGPKEFNCCYCGFKSNDKVNFHKHYKRLSCFNESIKFDDLFQSEKHTEGVNLLDASANVKSDVYTDAKISTTEDKVTRIFNLLEILKPLRCKICGYISTTKCNRERHEKMVHMLKPYNCSHCDFKTKYKHTFFKHCIRHNCANEKHKAVHSYHLERDSHTIEKNSKVSSRAKTDKLDATNNSMFHLNKKADIAEENRLTDAHLTPITKHSKKVFDCNHCEYRTDRRELINLHQKRFHCHNGPSKTNNLDNPNTDRNRSSVGQVKSVDGLDQHQNQCGASHHIEAAEANCDSKNGVNGAVMAVHANKNISNNRTKKRKIKKAKWKRSRAKKKGKTNPLHCRLCKMTFKATNALKRHKILIHGPKSLNCDHCGYKTNRKDLFDKHGIRFNCSYNGKGQSSVGKSDRDVHAKENSHEIMPHVDTANQIGYTRITRSRSRIDSGADNRIKKDKSKVSRSLAKVKKKATLLKCGSCNISFKKKISFIRHQKLIHEPKSFNCQHCGFKGNRKDTFDKHYNRFNCPKQSQENLHSDQLPGAVQSKEINSTEIPYDLVVETTATTGITDSVDDSDNINTGDVNTGVYSYTSIHAIGQETTTAQKVTATNLFECKIFKRTFRRRYHLKTHERKIHRPNEFSCCHCGFKSNDKVTFHKHYRHLSCFNESIEFDDLFQSERHTERINSLNTLANVESDVYTDAKISTTKDKLTRIINPLEILKCKICGYISKTKYNLERHEKIVHMLKPYNCSHSGLETKSKYTFLKHYIRHNFTTEKQKAVHFYHPQRDSLTMEENSNVSSRAETDKLDTTDNYMFHSNKRAESAEGNRLTDAHRIELAEAMVGLDNGQCVNSLDKDIITTNLSNSIDMSCIDSAEAKKDGDTVFDSDICFRKDDDDSIVYESRKNVHSKETETEKIVTDDADVMDLESAAMDIVTGNNGTIPVADCISFNRSTDITGRTAASVCCVDTAETDSNSLNEVNMGFITDPDKGTGTLDQKRNEADHKCVYDNIFESIRDTHTVQSPSASGSLHGANMIDDITDECSTDSPCGGNVEADANSDNEIKMVKPIDLDKDNVACDLKRNEADHINEVGNLSPYQGDTKTVQSNSTYTPHDEGAEIEVDSGDGYSIKDLCPQLPEIRNESCNKSSQETTADIASEQNESYHKSESCKSYPSQGEEQTVKTKPADKCQFEVSDRVVDISSRYSVKVPFLETAEMDGDSDSKSNVDRTVSILNKCIGSGNQKRDETDNRNKNGHFLLQGNLQTLKDPTADATFVEGGEMNLYKVNRCIKNVPSVETSEKISNSHNKGTVYISSGIMNRNTRISGLNIHEIDYSNVGESPCSHAMPNNFSQTSGPEDTEIKLYSVGGTRPDILCLENAETNKYLHNKHGTIIIADLVNNCSSTIGEDRNELPQELHATPQNSAGRSHVDKAKMCADGANESFNHIPHDKTLKTRINLPFERSLDIALDIARNSVHTANEISSIKSKSSSHQGNIKIHQTSRNDAPFQSQRNVDIGSDIMNSNARINCIKRHEIDCGNVGESPYSHAMPKVSSETFGPVVAEINLDSVDGPRTDIPCLENAETNEHSHNKRGKIIIADVVNSYSSTIDEDRTDLPKILHATPQNSFRKSHIDKAKMNADVTNESFNYIPHDKTSKTSRNLSFECSLDIALDIARNSVHAVNEISNIESKSSSHQGNIKIHQTNRDDALFQPQRNVYLTEKSFGDISSAEAMETNAMNDHGGIVNIANMSIGSGVNTCVDISNAEGRTSSNVILRKESRKYIVTSQAVENPFAGNVMNTKSIMYLKKFIKKKSTSRNREVKTNLPRCRFCKIAFARWALVRHHEKSVHESQVSKKEPSSVSANKSSSHRIYSIPLRFVSSFSDTDQSVIGYSSHKKTETADRKDVECMSESATKINSSSTQTNRTLPTYDVKKVNSSTQSVLIKNTSTGFPTDKKKNIDHNLEKTSCNTDQTTEIGHSESLSKSATEYSSVCNANRGNVSLAIVDTDEHTTYLNVRNKLSIDQKPNAISMSHNTMPDSIHTTAQMQNPEFIPKPAGKLNSISSSISIEKRNISEDKFGEHCNVRNNSNGCLKEVDNSSSSHGSNTYLNNMKTAQRSTGPRIQGFLQRLHEAAVFIYCHECDHVDEITYASNSV